MKNLEKLNGLFQGFAIVNTVTNECQTYEISDLSTDMSLEASVTNLLTYNETDVITFQPISNWRITMTDLIKKWFMQYPTLEADLSDKGYQFERVLKIVLHDLEEMLVVERAVTVHLDSQSFYKAHWDDIALEGKNGKVFIHFGVSD